jgi:hypothetical protein
MNLVEPVPAALAGIALFIVPGLLLLALLPARERAALAFDEALFLTVAVSVCASAWLGLVLAELGAFSLTRAALIVGVVAAGTAALLRRRLAWPWPRPGRAAALVPAALVLAASFALHARPTEYLVGGRDPGIYVATMALIARTGGVAYVDPGVLSVPPEDVELFYRNPQGADFSWGRFMGVPLESPRSGRVVPEFFHLFPAFGAYLFQSMGVKGALATPPLFGILGTLAVYFALRRLLGGAPALLAALLLAVNVVQVWFARYPVSEGLSQLLFFLAFLAAVHWEERGGAAFGALAGAALGLTLLVRVDSVLLLPPLAVYLLWRHAAHGESWRRLAVFAIPFLVLAGHALAHALLFSRKYLLNLASRPYWQQPPLMWGLALLAAAALFSSVRLWGPPLVRHARERSEAVRRLAMGAVALAALYAYFLRPWLSAWAGADGNDRTQRLADPGLLRALGFHRLAAHDAQSLVRLGWFVGAPVLLLALLGLLGMMWRWRRAFFLPTAVTLTFTVFYLYKMRVWNDYYFALRRFVPLALPWVMAWAALALWRLARGGRARAWAAGALAMVALALQLRATLPLVRHVDWKGAVAFVDDVARRFGPDDAVIFEQPRSIHLLSLPLWAVHGVNTLELARFNPDPERLDHLVRSWRGRYRNVYFVHTYSTDLCGLFLQRMEEMSFGTHEWERALGRPPRGPQFHALRFRISRVVPPEQLQVPALPEVDIGGSDDFQVSGFFDKEGGGARTFRWTGACASVYLPGARPGAELQIVASGRHRPSDKPDLVRATLSGQPLGTFRVGDDWQEHVLRLPDPLPAGPPVLRLDVAAWRPANVVPTSQDVRDLGIMVDRLVVGAPPARPRGPDVKMPVSTGGGPSS